MLPQYTKELDFSQGRFATLFHCIGPKADSVYNLRWPSVVLCVRAIGCIFMESESPQPTPFSGHDWIKCTVTCWDLGYVALFIVVKCVLVVQILARNNQLTNKTEQISFFMFNALKCFT